MAAVIGLGPEKVKEILGGTDAGTIDIANYNSPKQIILSGPVEDLDKVADAFIEGGARRYIPLKVSAAFHSRYMEEAGTAFAEFLESVTFNDLEIPVIANVSAAPYRTGTRVSPSARHR